MGRCNRVYDWMVPLLIAGCLSACSRPVADVVPSDQNGADDLRAVLETGASGGGSTSVAIEPTGFATLRGLVQLSRPVKSLKGLEATGNDSKLCSADGSRLPNTALQVGADNGLANVAIWLTKPRKVPEDAKWIHEQYQATRDATLTGKDAFDQKGCVFLSRMFAMRSTQKLQILNSDTMLHNTKIEGDAAGGAAQANSGISGGGNVFYEPGGYSNQPFKVSCSIHGWMEAWMLVRPNPFFAVSGLDGNFEIAHLPAGVDLEFRVSHEGRFLDGKRVKATRNGETLVIKSGRLKLSGIDPEDVIELKFVLDADAYGWE